MAGFELRNYVLPSQYDWTKDPHAPQQSYKMGYATDANRPVATPLPPPPPPPAPPIVVPSPIEPAPPPAPPPPPVPAPPGPGGSATATPPMQGLSTAVQQIRGPEPGWDDNPSGRQNMGQLGQRTPGMPVTVLSEIMRRFGRTY